MLPALDGLLDGAVAAGDDVMPDTLYMIWKMGSYGLILLGMVAANLLTMMFWLWLILGSM